MATRKTTSAKKASAKKTPAKKASAKKASARKSAPRSRARAPASGAIALLMADHQDVKKLFNAYKRLAKRGGGDTERQRLAQEICAMLTVHATVEEEIFYPAAKGALDEPDLVAEATVEHASAKDLIAQIEDSSPADEIYDAKVKVLGEYVDHHVQEEERKMFPKLRRAGLDLDALGERIAARKQELQLDRVEA
jgi:hemerythrin superfamily protein